MKIIVMVIVVVVDNTFMDLDDLQMVVVMAYNVMVGIRQVLDSTYDIIIVVVTMVLNDSGYQSSRAIIVANNFVEDITRKLCVIMVTPTLLESLEAQLSSI